MRIKQPYLINPITENPYEVFTTPSRRVVAQTDNKGRFKKVVSISRKKKRKAKKISKSAFSRLVSKLKKKRVKKLHRRVIRKHKTYKRHKTYRKHSAHKVHRKRLQKSFDVYKDLLKTSGLRMTKKDRAYKKKYHLNPLLVVNPHKRRKKMKSRKYRRNPFITSKQFGEVSTLLVDGAIIVGGIIGGKFIMDKLSNVKMLQKPMVKIGAQIAIGSLIYILGKQTKKIPMRYVNLLALGMIAPAISDAVGLITHKSGEVSEIGNDYDENYGAYVPDTSAYVPEVGGLGDDYGA